MNRWITGANSQHQPQERRNTITQRNWVLRDGTPGGSLSHRHPFSSRSYDPRAHISRLPGEPVVGAAPNTPQNERDDEHVFAYEEYVESIQGTDPGDTDDTLDGDRTVYLDDLRVKPSTTNHEQPIPTKRKSVDSSVQMGNSISSYQQLDRETTESTGSSSELPAVGYSAGPTQITEYDSHGKVTAVFERRSQGSRTGQPMTRRNSEEAATYPQSSSAYLNGGFVCESCNRPMAAMTDLSRLGDAEVCRKCGQLDSLPYPQHHAARLNPAYQSQIGSRKDSIQSAPAEVDEQKEPSAVAAADVQPLETSSLSSRYNSAQQYNDGPRVGDGQQPYEMGDTLMGNLNGFIADRLSATPPPVGPRTESLMVPTIINGVHYAGVHYAPSETSGRRHSALAVAIEPVIQELSHNRKFCAAVLFVIFFAALIGVGIALTIYLD